MKLKYKRLGKQLSIALLLSVFLMPASLAAQNLLNAIQINPDGDTYKIVLKTNEKAPLKKIVESGDKIYLELQNVSVLNSVKTVYNDVPDVNNVIIEPTSKNSVKIFLHGKNMNNAKVQIETLNPVKEAAPQNTASAPESIELNPPIEAYNPIYDDEMGEDENFSLMPFLAAVAQSFKKIIGPNTMYFLGLILIFAFGMRLFKKNAGYSDAISIGLPRRLKENMTEEEESEISREKTHLETLRTAPRTMPKTLANYGIKSYQSSQKNPYTSHFRNNTLKQPKFPTVPSSSKEIKTEPATALKSKLITATLNSHASEMNQAIGKNGVDSVKFIESMTQIYEKNGRTDLAEGLRKSLKKTKGINL